MTKEIKTNLYTAAEYESFRNSLNERTKLSAAKFGHKTKHDLNSDKLIEICKNEACNCRN